MRSDQYILFRNYAPGVHYVNCDVCTQRYLSNEVAMQDGMLKCIVAKPHKGPCYDTINAADMLRPSSSAIR